MSADLELKEMFSALRREAAAVSLAEPSQVRRRGTQRNRLRLGSAALAVVFAVTGVTVGVALPRGLAPTLHPVGRVGHTRMTLTVSSPNGAAPDPSTLAKARTSIKDTLGALGISGGTVETAGDRTLVVSVDGRHGEELRQVVTSAQLRFRQVLSKTPAEWNDTPGPAMSGAPSAVPSDLTSSTPDRGSTAESMRQRVIAKLGPAYQFAQQMGDPAAIPAQQRPAVRQTLAPFARLTPAEVAVLPADIQFKVPTITCETLDSRLPGSVSDISHQITACGKEDSGPVKYLLGQARLVGEDVAHVEAQDGVRDGIPGWEVVLTFTSSGQTKFTNLTRDAVANHHQQVALVAGNAVVTAPSITTVVPGDTEINGPFTQAEARVNAARLRQATLPLAFSVESVEEA